MDFLWEIWVEHPITLADNVTAVSISQDGTIVQQLDDGTVDNGTQIGLARVTNPEGLEKSVGACTVLRSTQILMQLSLEQPTQRGVELSSRVSWKCPTLI